MLRPCKWFSCFKSPHHNNICTSPLPSTWKILPPPLIIPDLIIMITFGQWYKLWSSTLCCLLQSCFSSFFLGPNIFLCAPLSKTEPTFFPKCGRISFTRRLWNSIKIQLPTEAIQPLTHHFSNLLLRYTVAKEKSVSSVEHSWTEVSLCIWLHISGSFLEDNK